MTFLYAIGFVGDFSVPRTLDSDPTGTTLQAVLVNLGLLALFAGVDKCRFKRPVRPGETLELATRVTRVRGPIGEAEAVATVDDAVACTATLKFAIVDRDQAGVP